MLIIHHWDTDGISSAAQIARFAGGSGFENLTPPVGEFSFDDRINKAVERHEEIWIADLNLPGEAERIGRRTTFVDHHLQMRIENPLVEHINPLLFGSSSAEYPSCSTVISDRLGNWDMLSVLGAFGDVGDKAKEHPKVRRTLENYGYNVEDVKKMVSLIDSNYLAMDRDSVDSAVRDLLELEPHQWLEHPSWNEKMEEMERSVRSILDARTERDGSCVMDFNSPYNIISKLTRKAVWELGYDAALGINRDLHGRAQTYLRVSDRCAPRMEIPSLIERLLAAGINAGGKEVVVGSVYPAERADEVFDIVKEHMDKRECVWRTRK